MVHGAVHAACVLFRRACECLVHLCNTKPDPTGGQSNPLHRELPACHCSRRHLPFAELPPPCLLDQKERLRRQVCPLSSRPSIRMTAAPRALAFVAAAATVARLRGCRLMLTTGAPPTKRPAGRASPRRVISSAPHTPRARHANPLLAGSASAASPPPRHRSHAGAPATASPPRSQSRASVPVARPPRGQPLRPAAGAPQRPPHPPVSSFPANAASPAPSSEVVAAGLCPGAIPPAAQPAAKLRTYKVKKVEEDASRIASALSPARAECSHRARHRQPACS